MIMKTMNILRYAAVLFAALTMSVMTSCEDPIDEPDDPNTENNGGNENGGNGSTEPEAANFPDLVEDFEVAPGSTLKLTFTPNYKWEVSVPSETFKYFWILDGTFKVDKLSGNASEEAVTVTIGVSEEEEFDNNRSCEVTLTMNEESKVIAKYMRPAKNRTLSVYSAQLDAEGNLQTDADGSSYIYGETEAASASLVWSASYTDFRLPVKVDANCEWQIEVPEWLDVEVPEKTTGVVELIFKGESLEEKTGKVAFKAGEETLKEIEVTLPSCKGVEIYQARITDGEFEYADGGYVWTEEPVEEVALVWMGMDFRMPVMISSKCDWKLEMPEWVDADIDAETAGEYSVVFTGVPSKYPLDDAEGKIVFKVGQEVLHEIPVAIPGCRDIMSFTIDMSLTELSYNAAGQLKTTTGGYETIDATGKVFGAKDVKVFVVETTGGVVGAEPSWFEVTVANYLTSDGAHVLQERDVRFEVEENKGYDERSAVVFFLPPSETAGGVDLFNSDATVKEEYAANSVNVHQLSSVYDDYLEFASADDMTEYEFGKADDEKKAALVADFGATDHVYVLTYNAEYSRVHMNMPVSYSSYKVFGADDKTADKSGAADYWLQFVGNDSRNGGHFDMYMGMTLPTEASVGYVVFYDEDGGVLAIVECVSPWKEEEIVTPPDEGEDEYEDASSYFVNASEAQNAGATLLKVLGGPLYDMSLEEIEQGATILKLTLPEGVPVDIDVKKKYKYYQMPYALKSYITVNDEDYGETSGITAGKTEAKISMVEIPSTMKDTPMVKFHTSFSETIPFLVIYLFLE